MELTIGIILPKERREEGTRIIGEITEAIRELGNCTVSGWQLAGNRADKFKNQAIFYFGEETQMRRAIETAEALLKRAGFFPGIEYELLCHD